ncbi:MAG: hypothetical protein HY264_01365 [Chloroflexi bacterium]|nr:hypothetical protein [Chloroflexota bacterium]
MIGSMITARDGDEEPERDGDQCRQARHLQGSDHGIPDPAAELAQVTRRVLDEEFGADHPDSTAHDVPADDGQWHEREQQRRGRQDDDQPALEASLSAGRPEEESGVSVHGPLPARIADGSGDQPR